MTFMTFLTMSSSDCIVRVIIVISLILASTGMFSENVHGRRGTYSVNAVVNTWL